MSIRGNSACDAFAAALAEAHSSARAASAEVIRTLDETVARIANDKAFREDLARAVAAACEVAQGVLAVTARASNAFVARERAQEPPGARRGGSDMVYAVSDRFPVGGYYQRRVGVSRFADELATAHRRRGVYSLIGDAIVQRHVASITGINFPVNQATLRSAPAKVFVAVHRGGGRFGHYIVTVPEEEVDA